jgi:hypothetical protein
MSRQDSCADPEELTFRGEGWDSEIECVLPSWSLRVGVLGAAVRGYTDDALGLRPVRDK